MKYEVQDIFITPSEQARGLMCVETYPPNACALFPYERCKKLTFHGRNCMFQIIVIFVRDDLSIDSWYILEPNGKPESSTSDCRLAIEMMATRANIDTVIQSVRVVIEEDGISLI